MSTSSTTETLAFFGATGGCTIAALTHSLQAGYPCRALARTPEKLLRALKKRGVANELLTPSSSGKGLEIIRGDVTNVEDVKRTLLFEGSGLADQIICGIGQSNQVNLCKFNHLQSLRWYTKASILSAAIGNRRRPTNLLPRHLNHPLRPHRHPLRSTLNLRHSP